MRKMVWVALPVAVLGGLFTFASQVAAATPNLYVSTTGSDSNPCTQPQPCHTVQHGIDVAPNGAIVHVAAGTYNQTFNITKPVTVSGAGAGSTIIDGSNQDYGALGYYGVVGIDNTSGTAGHIVIRGFTVHNAFVTPDESNIGLIGATDVYVGDANAGDNVSILHDVLGPVQDPASYGGIGLDTLNAQPPILFNDNTVTGTFQGALVEGGGSNASTSVDRLTGNTFTKLIACSGTCSGGGSFPPEGVFILSDQAGTSHSVVSNNRFTHFAGYGVAVDAGYAGGNCSPPATPCPGNASVTINGNSFALGGAAGAAAIYLHAQTGNSLTGTVNNDNGTVKSPTQAIVVKADSGGSVNVSESNDDIDQV